MLSARFPHVCEYAWDAWASAYTGACVCRAWKKLCPAIVRNFKFPRSAWEKAEYIDYALNFRHAEALLHAVGEPYRYDWKSVSYAFEGFGEREGVFGTYEATIFFEQALGDQRIEDQQPPEVRVMFGPSDDEDADGETTDRDDVDVEGALVFFDQFGTNEIIIVPFEAGEPLDTEVLWDIFSLKNEFKGECHCGDIEIDDVVGCVDTFAAEGSVISELDCAERASLWFHGDDYKTISVTREVANQVELSNCVIALGFECSGPLVLPFGKLLTASRVSRST